MFFECFYDIDFVQVFYMVGCQWIGECFVIDLVCDVQQYLEKVVLQCLCVIYVIEIYIYVDYFLGSCEFVVVIGVQLLLFGEGGVEWCYDFGDQKLYYGDVFWVGNVKVEVWYIFGYIFESFFFLVIDIFWGDVLVMCFIGDFVFVGDVGCFDLFDEVVGGVEIWFVGVWQMFVLLCDQFLILLDGVQVWFVYGSGSVCGKVFGVVLSIIVGYE